MSEVDENKGAIPWPKILTGVTILVFCLQLGGNYGLFVQLPERMKEVLGKISLVEAAMYSGMTRHAETKLELDHIEKIINRIVSRLDDIEKVNRDQTDEIHAEKRRHEK